MTHRDQPASGSGCFALVLLAPVAVVAALVMVGTMGSNQDDGALPQLGQPARTTALIDLTTVDSTTEQPTDPTETTEPGQPKAPVTGQAAIRVSHQPDVPSGQTSVTTTTSPPAAREVTSVVRVTTTQAPTITTVPRTSTPHPVVTTTATSTTVVRKPDCDHKNPCPTKTSEPPHHPKRK